MDASLGHIYSFKLLSIFAKKNFFGVSDGGVCYFRFFARDAEKRSAPMNIFLSKSLLIQR